MTLPPRQREPLSWALPCREASLALWPCPPLRGKESMRPGDVSICTLCPSSRPGYLGTWLNSPQWPQACTGLSLESGALRLWWAHPEPHGAGEGAAGESGGYGWSWDARAGPHTVCGWEVGIGREEVRVSLVLIIKMVIGPTSQNPWGFSARAAAFPGWCLVCAQPRELAVALRRDTNVKCASSSW